MGIFYVEVEVSRATRKAKRSRVKKVLVDTGSEITWLPEDTLKRAGIDIRKKDQPFLMANGETVTRDIGYGVIRCGEFETIDEVVFARRGDLKLLGSRTLEGFNARVDSVVKKLVAAGPIPAVSSRRRGVDHGWLRTGQDNPLEVGK